MKISYEKLISEKKLKFVNGFVDVQRRLCEKIMDTTFEDENEKNQ